jgi:heat shock protein HtpX
MDFRSLQSRNRWATRALVMLSFLLLAFVAAFVSLLTVGGWVAAVIAIAIAGGMSFAGYRSSDRLALSATGARPADPEEFRQLHNIVEEMALAAGVPKPRVYVVDDPAPNAFATGRDPQHAAIAVTTGLLTKMNRQELTGVVAHEMAHVRNLDIRVMTVAVATAGAIAIIADVFMRLIMLGARSTGRSRRSSSRNDGAFAIIALVGFVVVVVLAPLAAGLLRAAVSRSRERLADASAVELTRDPSGIRRALEKLQADVTVVSRTSHATSHLWIESPDDTQAGHRGSFFNRMFETHPPLVERIDLLRRMEGLAPTTGPDPVLLAELRQADQQSTVATPSANESWSDVANSSPHPGSMMGLAAPVGAAVLPPSGWYADPADAQQVRWWDGQRWTDHVSEVAP